MTTDDEQARIQVNKFDAARRQLQTALHLYFFDGDPVAVHTLVAAAHEVLRDLARKEGRRLMIEESLERALGPEATREALGYVRRAQNFFKHADRDGEEVFAFHPRSSDFLLLDCAARVLQITGEQTLLERAFEKWLMLQYPQFWRKTSLRDLAVQASRLFGGMDRQELYARLVAEETEPLEQR